MKHLKAKNAGIQLEKTIDVDQYKDWSRELRDSSVMPLDMKKDVDYIDPSHFYDAPVENDTRNTSK
jgi:hypothetical protein